MSNADTRATWTYHDATKHSPESVRRSGHTLEWDIMPRPFKVYLDLEPIALPLDFIVSTRPALAAIEAVDLEANAPPEPVEGQLPPSRAAIDLAALARLLHFSAGVLRRRTYPGGEIFYRAAACTGALYHIDVYLVAGELADLSAGVYHFGPHDFSLRRLRRGDYRGALTHAAGGNPAVAAAPAVLIYTSTFWRNSWKYQARAYRHCFWDEGTILANLLAVAAAAEIETHVGLGFVDAEVNRLLDLDTLREVSLSLVALGGGDACPASVPPIEPVGLRTMPYSQREVDYPEIRAMHEASSLATADEVAEWSGRAGRPRPAASQSTSPQPAADGPLRAESIEAVILRRGSSRHFGGRSITAEQLSTILHTATAGIPADFVAPGESLVDAYVIANAVDGLESGTYFYQREPAALVPLRQGEFRREAGYLDLGQDLAHDAAVNIYWLANLPPILQRLGNRGYRAAQLEAAVAGGKAYLASYALRLGATGLTFFDDEVTELFSPHAARKSVMFLMAVGQGGRSRDG